MVVTTVSNANVLDNAYQPEVGDIIENPIIVSLPYSAENVSNNFPYRANYQLSNDAETGADIVYRFDLVLDSYVDIEIANTNTAMISILC